MFNNAMVLGKFYPFHKGHQYLIDTARAQSKRVHVFVCSQGSDIYPGEVRYNWIKKHYESDSTVNVIHISQTLPQEPKDHPDFWNIWVSVVKNKIPYIDAIFTSEPYGTPFAKHLNVKHVMVDELRVVYPISGTLARADIWKTWEYLPAETQKYFEFRVCIVGPESTGKSTLSTELADNFRCGLIEEYGREYCDSVSTNNLSHKDFINIARGHALREKETRLNFGMSISDTDALTTYMFYQMYCDRNYLMLDLSVGEQILSNQKHYDLYLLTDNSIDWINDGQRDFGHIRDKTFETFKLNYPSAKRISGTGPKRFKQALKYIEEAATKKPA